jgi:TolB protein
MANTPDKGMHSYLISAEGGTPQQLIPGDHHYATPGWSPDGNRLVVADWAREENQRQVHIWDLRTKQLTTIPDSRGLHFPIWSPDGRYIAATTDDENARLFDLTAQKWTPLPPFGNWEWSHDGQYIYAYRESENGISRLRLRDHKVEKVASLRGITPAAGVFGIWFGLATDDTPLVLRGLSSQNIYAFDWTTR